MIPNFSSDKPITNKDQDRFQRYSFSKRIAETIIKRENEEGIVIGLYGAWGEGKTSVLNFIKNELDQESTILSVTLNPWRYNDEETLIKNFLKKIADVLGKEINNNKEKFGDFVTKYGSLGSLVGKDISQIGKLLSKVDLEDLKNRLDEFLKESDNKLVIFVDDIDRLDKNEIYSLFRLVKLTADFSNTTYILSFDEKMVASAIGERFGAGNQQSGQNFLEKIIQVPLKIPPAQIDALRKYCYELVDKAINENELDLPKDEVQRFVNAFSSHLLLRLKTPRLAIRYGNSLSFAIPLLKGEVNQVDLMLIEAIKIFFPDHYDFIKTNPHFFTSSYSTHSNYNSNLVQSRKDDLTEHLDRLSQNLTKPEKEAIFNLLKLLFPRLEEAYHNTFQYEGSKNWAKDKKIASTSYFKRYFSYAVISGELSDVEFDSFMSSLETEELETIVEKIQKIIEKSSPETFLHKARTFEEELNWEASQNLILSIAVMSRYFPKNDSFFAFGMDGARSQAAIFIYNLLKNHKDKEDVFELAKTLMGENIEFDFAYKLNNWMRSGKTMEEKLFKNEEYIELAKILKDRALKESKDQPIFEKFPENLSYILSTWHEANSEELENYLREFIDKDPEHLKNLIIALTPTATSSDHPEPYKSNFTNENYEYLIRILQIDYIVKIIEQNFLKEIEEEKTEFFDFENNQTNNNILRQFWHWYLKDLENKEVIE